MVFTSIARLSVARRIPLIRFRKGGFDYQTDSATASGTSSSGGGSGSESVNKSQDNTQVKSAPVIYDWELPPRYQRKPLDQTEIDYINRGGPE